jgi:hypothetical protein
VFALGQETVALELLECLVDDAESTDMIVEMLADGDVRSDAGTVDARMRELERTGVVVSMEGVHPLRPAERDTWWRLTETVAETRGLGRAR